MFDTPEPIPQPRQLHIWQQNLNGSLEGQLDLLQSLNPKLYDLAMLQEPHIDFLSRTCANSHWIPIYPLRHLDKPKATRSIILVNTKISTNVWTPIKFESPDVTSIQMHGDYGTLHIINIYNDCKHAESLKTLELYMKDPATRAHPIGGNPLRYIWMGDFNCHHPLWDEERNEHLFTRPNLAAT